MNKILQQEKGKILILSGSGINGTFEEFKGKRTERAIVARLKKEICHGDRWARAYIYLHDNEFGDEVYMNLENYNDFRTIPKNKI